MRRHPLLPFRSSPWPPPHQFLSPGVSHFPPGSIEWMSPSYIFLLLPFAPLLTIIPHSIQHARLFLPSFLPYPPTRSVAFTVFHFLVLYLGRVAEVSSSLIFLLPLFMLATFLCFCISFARNPLLRERERRSKARHSWTWVAPPVAAGNIRARFLKPLRRRAIKSVSFVDLGRLFCYFPRCYDCATEYYNQFTPHFL